MLRAFFGGFQYLDYRLVLVRGVFQYGSFRLGSSEFGLFPGFLHVLVSREVWVGV